MHDFWFAPMICIYIHLIAGKGNTALFIISLFKK